MRTTRALCLLPPLLTAALVAACSGGQQSTSVVPSPVHASVCPTPSLAKTDMVLTDPGSCQAVAVGKTLEIIRTDLGGTYTVLLLIDPDQTFRCTDEAGQADTLRNSSAYIGFCTAGDKSLAFVVTPSGLQAAIGVPTITTVWYVLAAQSAVEAFPDYGDTSCAAGYIVTAHNAGTNAALIALANKTHYHIGPTPAAPLWQYVQAGINLARAGAKLSSCHAVKPVTTSVS